MGGVATDETIRWEGPDWQIERVYAANHPDAEYFLVRVGALPPYLIETWTINRPTGSPETVTVSAPDGGELLLGGPIRRTHRPDYLIDQQPCRR